MRGLLIIAGLLAWQAQAQACEISMGYRTTARMPNINAKPDNSGLYFDLYSRAAQDIGCKLKVVRDPKNRILRALADGSIDFYPGLTFTEVRAKYTFFYDNGIPSANVGLTRKGSGKINRYDDLVGKVVLVPLGSPGPKVGSLELQYKRPPELSFERAIELILAEQADFYMDEFGTLYYYLVQHPRESELMLHLNCCGGLSRLTLGFSKKSPHFKAVENPDYDASKPLSVYNYPTQAALGSVADQFRLALLSLEARGFTNTLYQDYYGANLPSLMKVD